MPPKLSLQHFKVSPSQQGETLIRFLADSLDCSGSKAKALLNDRSVWVNGNRVWMAKHPLSRGDTVEVRGHVPTPSPQQPLELLYEDDWLLGVNKPAGQVSESRKQSVESSLRTQLSNPKLRALHRLDKDTSGILLFTKDPSPREVYVDLFRSQSIGKQYSVLLAGTLPFRPVEVNKRLEGKEARSVFDSQKSSGDFCRASCTIFTGRTHQIRKHAGVLGCRVLGDAQYQGGPEISQKEKKIPRQMLHAEHLTFSCPHTHRERHLHAPWPEDFTQTATFFDLLP